MFGLFAENIHFSHPSFQIKGVNIKAEKGQITSLFGPSGCGKSTLLKIIAGLYKPKLGKIEINGKVVHSDHKFTPIQYRNISFVFQHPSLLPHKTVLENVMFSVRKNISNKKQLAMKYLKKMRMSEYANHHPCTLSGGQQQLVTIARALAYEPDLFLLDEPFSSVDIISRRRIMEYIVNLLREEDLPAILVTHDPEEALSVSDVIYALRDGEVIQEDTPENIYNHPSDISLAEHFGIVNHITGRISNGILNTVWGDIQNVKQYDTVCARPEAISIDHNSNIIGTIEKVKIFNRMALARVKDSSYWMTMLNNQQHTIGQKLKLKMDLSKIMLFKTSSLNAFDDALL